MYRKEKSKGKGKGKGKSKEKRQEKEIKPAETESEWGRKHARYAKDSCSFEGWHYPLVSGVPHTFWCIFCYN